MKVNINPEVIMNEKNITKDLEKFAKTCATIIVNEAAQLIKKFAYKQMAGYYEEYDPRIYIRTEQMLKSSYKPFVVTTGDVYEEIYDNVWIKGTHGYEKVGYGTNSHWEELIGLSDRINKLKREAYSKEVKEKLLAKGIRKAKSQSYTILNFK